MIKLQEQSYQSNFYFPRPEIHFDAENGLGIIAFPWGNRSSAKKAIDYIIDFFHSTQNDQEVTSPFDKLSCLSPLANNIRVALMLTNDLIYKEDNADEIVSGLEVLLFAHDRGQVVFGQVGAPALYLAKGAAPLINLSSYFDLSISTQLWENNKTNPPLPSTLLGTHSTSTVRLGTFKPNKSDKLILTSLNRIPNDLVSLARSNYRFRNIVDHFVNQNSEQGFWVGQVTF